MNQNRFFRLIPTIPAYPTSILPRPSSPDPAATVNHITITRSVILDNLEEFAKEEIEQAMDRARPKMERVIDDTIRGAMGWEWFYHPKEPYQARKRIRWSDGLIPE